MQRNEKCFCSFDPACSEISGEVRWLVTGSQRQKRERRRVCCIGVQKALKIFNVMAEWADFNNLDLCFLFEQGYMDETARKSWAAANLLWLLWPYIHKDDFTHWIKRKVQKTFHFSIGVLSKMWSDTNNNLCWSVTETNILNRCIFLLQDSCCSYPVSQLQAAALPRILDQIQKLLCPLVISTLENKVHVMSRHQFTLA